MFKLIASSPDLRLTSFDYSPAIKDASWEKREVAVLRFPVACTSVNVAFSLVNYTETDAAMPTFLKMVLTTVWSFYPLPL